VSVLGFLGGIKDGIGGALGLTPSTAPLTPAEQQAFNAVAASPGAASEGTGVATAGLGPANGVLNAITGGPGSGSQTGTGATAVGTPFAGAKSWLLGFGLLAGIALLTSESGKYAGLGTAILALIVVSYFFVSYGQLTSQLSTLFGGGPNLNPGGVQ
jgi:hypothetical protein